MTLVSGLARSIEAHFPTTKTAEPEVLAHHLTAAGLADAAIPLWQAAGELALKRMAMTEAIAHLNQGLELVSTLPRSSERDASELRLRSRLGTAWLALNGPGRFSADGLRAVFSKRAPAPLRADAVVVVR